MCPGSAFASRARPASVMVTVTPRSSSGEGGARDESGVFHLACLIGQTTAAVDHAIGEVGHPQAAGRGVAEPSQDLELHVAEVAGGAQLLLDRVTQQAGQIHQREVGAELDGVEGRAVRSGIVTILLASGSKQW